MSSTDTKIVQLLHQHFTDCQVQLTNESHLHAGHAGDNGSGESHYTLHIRWAGFEGIPRIHRQRMVMDILKPLINAGPIHALSIRAVV